VIYASFIPALKGEVLRRRSDKEEWWKNFNSLWEKVAQDPDIQNYANSVMFSGVSLPQREVPYETVDAIDLNVIKKASGWTLANDGQVCGLIAGDQGYEATGIYIPLAHIHAFSEDATKEKEKIAHQAGVQAGLKIAIKAIMEEVSLLTNCNHSNEVNLVVEAAIQRMWLLSTTGER
jgi:hypothetical protein